MLKEKIRNLFSIETTKKYDVSFCRDVDTLSIKFFGLHINISKECLNLKYMCIFLCKKVFSSKLVASMYLKKYRKRITNRMKNDGHVYTNERSDYVWSMWWQNDIPEIIQICLDSIKKFYPNLIIITKDNVSEYIDIPDYILQKLDSNIIAFPQFSDYIRVCLLDKYGGMWLDSSLLMFNEIPKFITKQDFFVLQDYFKKQMSNFFICSTKNNYITRNMRLFLEEYWKKENFAIDYFMFHKYFMLSAKYDPEFKKIYDNIIPDQNAYVKYLSANLHLNADRDCWEYLKATRYFSKVNRKNLKAIENKNSWYWFILNEYKKSETLAGAEKRKEV
jgi:hypothetical protein